MPFWIEGWVEVARVGIADQDDEHVWQGAINLGSLIDVAERLFGLSKQCTGEIAPKALAARRCVPKNPSPEVRIELEKIRQHEQQHGPGEFGGYTHARWSEIKAVSIAAEVMKASDWRLVFALLQRLELDDRFSAEKIRVVVWYNW